ncbi:CotS family spore coat protein [Caloramator sp. ALD01]|uniref:CotS family spore coat protein n=1 Tax=Caloramator sp. ALD01 TaxID=1031288 RepID=UPI00042417AE|nr:CotS family spore coat protein [Caloramator sp. ALD01]
MEYNIIEASRKDYSKEEIKYILSHFNCNAIKIENIKAKDTDKARAVYKIYSNTGNKCLKKTYHDEPTLLFIYSIIEWLNIFNIKCPRFLKTNTGIPYLNYRGDYFILMDWIEGRKCDYDNIDDVLNASCYLAKIHLVTRNFKSINGSRIIYGDNGIYDSYSKHFSQLLNTSNKAFYYKDDFSKLFIDNADYYIECAKESLYLLSQIDFNSKELEKSICHYDYVNKNIIFNSDINIIDFDKSKYDYSINDFYVFIKRILKRKSTCWNFNLFKQAVEYYEKNRSINYLEFKLLLAQLMFPNKIWKITRDYYKNIHHCNKKAFYKILKDTISQKEYHKQFIANAIEFFNQKY